VSTRRNSTGGNTGAEMEPVVYDHLINPAPEFQTNTEAAFDTNVGPSAFLYFIFPPILAVWRCISCGCLAKDCGGMGFLNLMSLFQPKSRNNLKSGFAIIITITGVTKRCGTLNYATCAYSGVTIFFGPSGKHSLHSLITVLIHNSGHFGPPLPVLGPGLPALPGLPMAIYVTVRLRFYFDSPFITFTYLLTYGTHLPVLIGGQYWRYRGGYGVDRGYPLTLNYWRNVQRPVNAAFQYYGVTYFFSGTGYQAFNDRWFRVSLTDCIYRITKREMKLSSLYFG